MPVLLLYSIKHGSVVFWTCQCSMMVWAKHILIPWASPLIESSCIVVNASKRQEIARDNKRSSASLGALHPAPSPTASQSGCPSAPPPRTCSGSSALQLILFMLVDISITSPGQVSICRCASVMGVINSDWCLFIVKPKYSNTPAPSVSPRTSTDKVHKSSRASNGFIKCGCRYVI
jgi:hypothetical protein